jgi:periplasmic protein TonB
MRSEETEPGEVAIVPICTMVIWLGCLGVGIAGALIPYPRPRAPENEQAPVQAQVMHVELTNDPSPRPDIDPARSPVPVPQFAPPAPPEQAAVPPAQPLVTLAVPSPSIAFAQPTKSPSRIVDARQAASAQPQPVAATLPSAGRETATPAAPKQLTYGEGEGRQPKPEYPREAIMARQQGTVVVQFTVGEDGRVQSAKAASPCPFAMLNQAAVRAVRETWRFREGPKRVFEVSIEFELGRR